MRILVVEDDADLTAQLCGALQDAGYAVDTADNGEDGHHLGDTEPYDAVILDLGLPGMPPSRPTTHGQSQRSWRPAAIICWTRRFQAVRPARPAAICW